MPGEAYGEEIRLIWPDGNDDGEINFRGHVPIDKARELLFNSEQLEEIVCDRPASYHEDDTAVIEAVCREMSDKARIEHVYGRWSMTAMDSVDFDGDPGRQTLMTYRDPGRGRFPMTQAILWPRPVCHLSVKPSTGVYCCTKCGRRFIGPTEPHVFGGLKDCPRLVGDEVGPFVDVHEELEPVEVQS